jgi:phage-related protein
MIERTWQNTSSFLFGTVDMFQRFGIQITDDGMPEDVLKPQLRERKVTVPLRNGAYDYGAHYYDERPLTINCVTVRAGTREDAREMAYILAKKSQIRLWNEPDKYYVGRIYQSPGLEVLRKIGNRFSLSFICEPFAYGETLTESFTDRRFTPNYKGTAETPTYIVIRNVGSGNVVNIQITESIKQEN